jgi:hypothetical protein
MQTVCEGGEGRIFTHILYQIHLLYSFVYTVVSPSITTLDVQWLFVDREVIRRRPEWPSSQNHATQYTHERLHLTVCMVKRGTRQLCGIRVDILYIGHICSNLPFGWILRTELVII